MSVLFRDGDPIVVEASFLIPRPVYGKFLSYIKPPLKGSSRDIAIIIDCEKGEELCHYTRYIRLATEIEILLYF
jgi:hypothetical protein